MFLTIHITNILVKGKIKKSFPVFIAMKKSAKIITKLTNEFNSKIKKKQKRKKKGRKMNIYPKINNEVQKLYENYCKNNCKRKNNVPEICGQYGRACRTMNENADKMLCNKCSLATFASIVDAINEKCKNKEKLGIKNVHDSDIRDIQECLTTKNIKVEYVYIKDILEYLNED